MDASQTLNVWSSCHHCGMSPIVGSCFRCGTCPLGPQIDLCCACYEAYLAGRVPHPPESAIAVPAKAHVFTRIEGSPPETVAHWLDIRCREAPPPTVPVGFLVRPEFRYDRSSVFGGHAFVIQYTSRTLILTALHVLDELIKLKGINCTAGNPRYSGTELPEIVRSVQLYDVLQERWMFQELGTAGPMLTLPNARTSDDEPIAYRDIAAFHLSLPHRSRNPGRLAEKEPEPGDPLWLAAVMPDRSRTRRAVCVEKTAQTLIFRYDESKRMASHASGAPILDRRGDVVGINTGCGRFGEHELGHANPVGSIRAHLADALS